MHDNLRHHAEDEELDQANGETEAGPVMAVLHNLQTVAVEVDITIKVHLVESLHGNLVLALVLGLVFGLLEGEVVLDWATGKLGLLILARADGGDHQPEASQQGESREEGEEEGSLEATTNLPRQPVGRDDQDGSKRKEREAVIASRISREGCILDGRVLYSKLNDQISILLP